MQGRAGRDAELAQPCVMDWMVTPPTPNSHVEILTPVPQYVTVFGDRDFKEVNWNGLVAWALVYPIKRGD